jgi:UDP-N-acetylmuramyl pentapeptide phosphotransferase/UDP-N-acetylglucosamine-1-phosphate transferase
MTKALLAVGAAAVGAGVTRWVAGSLIPHTPLLRRNHRGVPVPTGLGVAVLVGFAAATGFVGFVRAVAPDAPTPVFALAGAVPLLFLGFGFGVLGLFDDVAAQPERGWRSHIPSLARGRLTPGALKVVGGGAIAFTAGVFTASSFGWALVHAALIALMANLFNALDVRPGRAAKVYLVAGIPMTILGRFLQIPLAATLGAVAAFMVFDLRERAMLGDAGSNAIGAILGGAVVFVEPEAWFRLALLGFLIILTAVAEGPTLSAWIDRIGPLRAFDRAGRAGGDGNGETQTGNPGPQGPGVLH